VSEDFKLDSGTWVNVGMLRVQAVAALAPLAQDAVLTGHDRSEIGLLVFPNFAECRALCLGLPPDAPMSQVLAQRAVREHVSQGLARLKRAGAGSSMYAAFAVLLEEPPSIDGGEITDKGYINQAAVLKRRVALVEGLYASPGDLATIRPAG
jgi:feruloyl-CoA synthase